MDKIINKIIMQAKKDKMVLAIAIFGSYARKEPHNDIDICIFLRKNNYSPKILSAKKLEYTQENEKYDVQIFQQLPLYIRERVIQEGKFVYGGQETELYELCFEMVRDLNHYKPLYTQYLEAVTNG